MTNRNSFSTAVMVLITVVACAPGEKNTSRLIADIPVCGTVQFSDGCSEELDPMISYGLALVHLSRNRIHRILITRIKAIYR
jgi:hypothetical protein